MSAKKLDVIFLRERIFLVLSSIYIAGIIYIGTQVLLHLDSKMSSVLGIVTFIVHICFVTFASAIVNAFYHEDNSHVRNQKKAIFVGTVVLAFLFPYVILVSYLSTGQIGSSKYYFYATAMAIIVFATTTIYKGVFRPLSTQKKEALKAQFDAQLEVLKGLLTAAALFLLGTAYSQILTGIAISNTEMFLAFYTFVGMVCLVLAPLVKSMLDLLGKLSEVAQNN